MYRSRILKEVHVKVDYDRTPILNLAIKCPTCRNWFKATDICVDKILYKEDLSNLLCNCKVCNEIFYTDDIIEEQDERFPDFYDECYKIKN